MNTKPLYLFVLVLGCQGGNLTLPENGSPGQLRAISGSDQQGHVNSDLPQPLVVQLTDGARRPLPNVALRFQTEVPAARLKPAEVVTDDTGYAAVRVRLGSREGVQTFEALLAQPGDTELRTTFTLFALANQPPPAEDADHGDQAENGDHNGNGGQAGNGHRGGDDHDDQDDEGSNHERNKNKDKDKHHDKDQDHDKDHGGHGGHGNDD